MMTSSCSRLRASMARIARECMFLQVSMLDFKAELTFLNRRFKAVDAFLRCKVLKSNSRTRQQISDPAFGVGQRSKMAARELRDGEVILQYAACMAYGAMFGYWSAEFYGTPYLFPGIFIRILWLGAIYSLVSPLNYVAVHVVLYFPFIVLPVLLEIAVDEIHAFKHWFDREPPLVDTVGWERVARLKSSNNGYNSDQFYPVTVIDFNQLDDPFWPHASTVFVVEIRRRCLIWRTIIIWRVSLLNGERKKVHQFHDFCRWTDGGNMFGRRFNILNCRVRCYQTNGVITVVIDYCDEKSIYIYDLRCGKQAVYKLPSVPSPGESLRFPVTICCLGRLTSNDGTMRGWRFRWFDATWDTNHGSIRARLIRKVVEFGMAVSVIAEEEIMFGSFIHRPNLLFVRTGRGAFGLEAKRWAARVLLFDPVTGHYIRRLTGEQQLLQFDRFFSSYNSLPAPDRRRSNHRCPAVLTDRECIECFCNGNVFRAQFATPTLKYRAAKMLFRANRDLRNRMNAEQFRQETGIAGMDGHFS